MKRILCFAYALIVSAAMYWPVAAIAGISNMQAPSPSPDFPTLYTAGDPVPISSALNAVAMLFGHGDTMDSVVVGGMSCMALVGLIAILMKSIMDQRFLVGQYLVMLFAAIAFFVPTTSLRVVSYFSSSGGSVNGAPPQYVDNVPLGMAYAAGIAGLIDYTVTTNIETAFSSASADNNYMSLGSDGFAKPLKILLDMRTMFDCNTHQTTCRNIQQFVHYCQFGGSNRASTLDMTQLDNPAPGAGILGFMQSQPQSYTQYVAQNVTPVPAPTLVPCSVAATGIVQTMQSYVQNQTVQEQFAPAGVTMAHDLQVVTAQNDSTIETPNSTFNSSGSAYDGYSSNVQNLVAQIGGDSNTFMINHVFSPVVLAAIQADANPDAAAQFAALMGEGVERARVSMAASGSMFVNFMTSSMNVFTFLFVALTPIVAIVCVGAGLGAAKIMITYLFFGIWTQSWMPCAAIISYYIQVSWQSMITGSRIPGMLFAPSQIDNLYNQTANMLASSGTLMAEAPLIMLAVMTGSMFALTGLAKKADGSEGYVDPNRVAPSLDKAANVAAIEGSYAANTGKPGAGSGYMGALRSHSEILAPDVAQSPTLQTGSSLSDGITRGTTAQVQHAQSVSDYAQAMAQFSQRFGSQAAYQKNGELSSSGSISQDASTAARSSIAQSDSQSNGVTNQNGSKLDGGLSVGAGGSGSPVSFKLAVGGNSSTSNQRTTKHDDTLATDQSGSNGTKASDSVGGKTGESGSFALSGNREQAESQVRQIGLQTSKTESMVQSAQHAVSNSESANAQNTVSLGALAQNAQQLPQDKQIAALSETQQAIRSTAGAASGGNAAQASSLAAKATAGLPKDGSYSPSSMNTLYRNAEGLLRSGNTAEHAVGYAIASKLAEATGYGDAQGLGRNASALASSASTLSRMQTSLGQPGLSADDTAKVAQLPGAVDTDIGQAAKQFGVSNLSDPNSVAPRANGVIGTTEGKVSGVEGDAAGVRAGATAQITNAKSKEAELTNQTAKAQAQAQAKHRDDPDNSLVPHTDAPVKPQPKPADAGTSNEAQQLYTRPLHSTPQSGATAAPSPQQKADPSKISNS